MGTRARSSAGSRRRRRDSKRRCAPTRAREAHYNWAKCCCAVKRMAEAESAFLSRAAEFQIWRKRDNVWDEVRRGAPRRGMTQTLKRPAMRARFAAGRGPLAARRDMVRRPAGDRVGTAWLLPKGVVLGRAAQRILWASSCVADFRGGKPAGPRAICRCGTRTRMPASPFLGGFHRRCCIH